MNLSLHDSQRSTPNVRRAPSQHAECSMSRTDTVSVTHDEWYSMKPVINSKGKEVVSKLWHKFLLKYWHDTANCVIACSYAKVSFFTSRKSSAPYTRQKAHCTFKHCLKFEVIVEKNETVIN